jgi:hypothetical protein
MKNPPSEAEDLGTRTFNGPLAIIWALFLFALFGFAGMPLRNALLVCWVRGADAYLHQGIRVLKGRPLVFSDGMAVPTLPASVTLISVFVAIVFGLSFLLLFGLRFYERHFKNRSSNA